MKVIIEYGNTKREIEGSFNLCASREDFQRLNELIESWLDGKSEYGWLYVTPTSVEQQHLADTPPISWEEAI